MANYSILINAVINAANLQTQITTLQNQKPITIPVNVNTQQVQQSLQQIQNQVPAGGLQLFNANSGVNAIEEARIAFQGLVKDIGQINNISVLSADQGATVKLNSQAIIDYTNNVGIASQAVLKFNETAKGSGQGAWDQTPIIKYNQDLGQTAADLEQITIWQNRLASMQIGKGEIFDTSQVKTDLADLSAAIETFGTVGGATTKDVSSGFSTLGLDIKNAQANLDELDAQLTAHQTEVDAQAKAEQDIAAQTEKYEADRMAMESEAHQQEVADWLDENKQNTILSDAQAQADQTDIDNKAKLDAATQKYEDDRIAAEAKAHEQEVSDYFDEQKQQTILSDAEDAAAQKDLENQAKEDQAQDNRHTKSQIIINDLDKQAQLYPEAFNSQEVQAAADALRNVTAAYDANLASENELKLAQNEYNSALAVTRGELAGVAGEGLNLNNLLEATAKKFIIWGVLMSSIYQGLAEINSGIQYIKDMNAEMTTTQMITNGTADDMQNLTNKYHDLAVQLGSTTLEVAKGAETWIRQGKSIEDTTKLLTAATMMSKMSGETAEDTSNYLTAIMNGFQLSADQAMTVLDKMTVLANSSKTSAAVSIGELSKALENSSAVAMQAGISYDQLLSYITTISTVTRKSADEIGTSFQSILSRMEQVKAGFVDAETGMDVNNVEIVLNKVGIALRDTSGQFRSMADVIDDVGKRWSTLDSIEQNQISTAIAGTRQRQNFTANRNAVTYGNVWIISQFTLDKFVNMCYY